MAFVDGIGDLPAGFGEEYVVVLIAGDETVSLKLFSAMLTLGLENPR